MTISFNRIILFSKNVSALAAFYQHNFNFEITEEIEDEWIVLKSGTAEIALHKNGKEYSDSFSSGSNSNTKLVFEIDDDLHAFRQTLIANGVTLKDIISFGDNSTLYCDGEDVEGNVFQLMQIKV